MTTMPTTARTRRPGFSTLRSARGLLGLPTLLETLRRWRRVARERHLLEELDDRMLRDIGLAREDARREAARPYWDSAPR